MNIQIIALTSVILTLGLCSCNTLQSVRVSSMNLLKGTPKKNIEKPSPSGEAPKKKNTEPNSKKNTSPNNPNPSPQTNVPALPEHITRKEQKESDEPNIVPPSKPKEKDPIQKEDPKKESILKPKLPAREGILPPS